MNDCELSSDQSEKDLGITFDVTLNFESHISNITAKANSRVGLIRRSFTTLNKHNFPILYKSLVRPLLEYCTPVWSPYLKKNISEIEKVQRRATKLVQGLKDLSYESRLRILGIPTLSYRRKRNDIIQVFKIMKGLDKIDAQVFFKKNDRANTRGHDMKLEKFHLNSTFRQHSFSQRTINTWNNLPQELIDADNIDTFKNRLNNHWKDDPGKFDPLFHTYF